MAHQVRWHQVKRNPSTGLCKGVFIPCAFGNMEPRYIRRLLHVQSRQRIVIICAADMGSSGFSVLSIKTLKITVRISPFKRFSRPVTVNVVRSSKAAKDVRDNPAEGGEYQKRKCRFRQLYHILLQILCFPEQTPSYSI